MNFRTPAFISGLYPKFQSINCAAGESGMRHFRPPPTPYPKLLCGRLAEGTLVKAGAGAKSLIIPIKLFQSERP